MAQLATLTVKLQAQIAEFQADFKEAAKSTEKFQTEFQGVATKASAYGNLIATGVQIGVGALKNLASSILENASNISDLSAKTGLSMKTIQQFQSVAEQTGTTVDAFADAAFKLGANLAGGNKSIVDAVTDLGLSFADLRAQSPDKQFDAITDALGRMEDPQERNRLGIIIFGRTFKEIAPAVAQGYKDMADQASLSSDKQIKALDAAGDAWARFKQNALTNATSFAGGIILRTEEVDAAVEKMGGRFDRFKMMMPGNVGAMADYLRALRDVREEADNFSLSKVVSEMQRVALLKLKPEEGPTLLQFGTADMKAVEAELDAGLKRQKTSFDEAKAAADAYRDSVIQLRDEFSGAKLQRDIKLIDDAFRALTDEQRKSPEVQDRVGEAAERLRQDGARLSPELLTLAVRTQSFSEWLNKVPGQTDLWATSFRDLRTALEKPLTQLRDVNEVLTEIALQQVPLPTIGLPDGVGIPVPIPELPDIPPNKWEGFSDSVGDAFSAGVERGLSALAHGEGIKGFAIAFARGVGDVLAASSNEYAAIVGNVIQGAFAIADATRGGQTQGQSTLGGAAAGAKAGMMFGPYGALIGAGIGAVAGFVRGMDNGREAIKAFADEFGGFDALHGKLLALGDEGENLWKRLTQSVANNDFNGAIAAIDLVTAALGRQKVVIEGLAVKVGDLATTAAGAGTLLDVSMVPYIRAALEAGAITDELAGKLLGMTVDNSMNWREMQSLAEKYGIEIGGLGAIFQQQKLTDTAAEIIRDFDRLILNGADFNAVLLGMTDEINNVVLESLKFGTEIPENMKPWIAELIATGRLLDGTGTKITDIDKLKFGPVIKSDVDKLVDAIKELIAAIGVKLPKAIGDLAGVRVPSVRVPVIFDFEEWTGPSGTTPRLAHGGIVRRPTLALIGEAGPEAVVPLNQLGSVAPQGGTSTVIFEVAGQRIARATVPYLPGEIRRYVPA